MLIISSSADSLLSKLIFRQDRCKVSQVLALPQRPGGLLGGASGRRRCLLPSSIHARGSHQGTEQLFVCCLAWAGVWLARGVYHWRKVATPVYPTLMLPLLEPVHHGRWAPRGKRNGKGCFDKPYHIPLLESGMARGTSFFAYLLFLLCCLPSGLSSWWLQWQGWRGVPGAPPRPVP